MAEYTEREALQEAFKSVTEDCTCPLHIAAEIDQILDQAPAADVVEVKHARWEKRGNHDWGCSACKIGVPYDRTGDHYCYNCGARMDG